MRRKVVTRVALGGVLLLGMALVLRPSPAGAQRVGWNDRGAHIDALGDAPTVRLWLEAARSFRYGEPVRVWFSVSDDAFVIVARVDANGHLTVLHPAGRARSAEVPGGTDHLVRGRRGAASFYATDRMGGGFVFAMASYEPFDLSRLGMRDFDRYVTGVYAGRPTRAYIGDPHRVIMRFASLVSFVEDSPFDYAVEFYNVDAPYYVTSAGFSNFCNGFAGQYRRGLQERWDDELFYGFGPAAGFGSAYDCANFNALCGTLGFLQAPWGYNLLGWGMGANPCFFPRGPQTGGGIPPVPPAADSLRVPGWLADSIRAGRPDTVGVIPEHRIAEEPANDRLRRSATGTDGSRRPVVLADDPSDKSYSIPVRSLRNTPTTYGEGRERDIGGTSGPGRDRISPVAGRDDADRGGIRWVHPPREAVIGNTRSDDGALPRSPRSGGVRGDGDRREGRPAYVNSRDARDVPPRLDRPSRGDGPRFDSPGPSRRDRSDSPRYDPPPPRMHRPQFSPSNGGGSTGPTPRSEPVRADGPRADAPRPSPPPPRVDPPRSEPPKPPAPPPSDGERSNR